MKDSNIRPKIIKLLEEKVSSKLLKSSLGYDILNLTPKAKATKAKIKVGLCQTKKLLHNKRNHQQNEKTTY